MMYYGGAKGVSLRKSEEFTVIILPVILMPRHFILHEENTKLILNRKMENLKQVQQRLFT